MNFDGTLIMKNGTKIPVTIDYIETTAADTFPKFEGHITGTALSTLYLRELNARLTIIMYPPKSA